MTDTAFDAPALPVMTQTDAEIYTASVCFKIGPPRLVGVELEWLVHDSDDPTADVVPELLAEALGRCCPPHLSNSPNEAADLPRRSRVTVEPGGQVELSSFPAESLETTIDDVLADSQTLLSGLTSAGLSATGIGIDPHRRPHRILDLPRYRAMESYFDRDGVDGRTMMCSTASIQVSLDAGTQSGMPDRWRALHQLGPTLVAAFANSPIHAGRDTGWKSARQAAWLGIDPARTYPSYGADPAESYARYAVDAPLLCVQNPNGSWEVPPGVTFADWISGALDRRPTFADLDYHLSTLFPPVRPRGYLEVRYLDAQPDDGWIVPTAVLWALSNDNRAMDTALAATEHVAESWRAAAQFGMSDATIAAAAQAVVRSALDVLPADTVAHALTTQFVEHYTDRGRSPADDLLDPATAPRRSTVSIKESP